MLKKVLAARVRINGYDTSETLDTNDSLAFLYILTGRYPEAKQLLETGLPHYQKVFGPNHPNTMRERFGLGRVLYNTGDYAKADELVSAAYQQILHQMDPTTSRPARPRGYWPASSNRKGSCAKPVSRELVPPPIRPGLRIERSDQT